MEKQWVLYMLECRDSSLYTGISNDLQQRLAAHQAGRGAKYTKGRGPLVLRYTENCQDHAHALRREIQIIKLTREQKLQLCVSKND